MEQAMNNWGSPKINELKIVDIDSSMIYESVNQIKKNVKNILEKSTFTINNFTIDIDLKAKINYRKIREGD